MIPSESMNVAIDVFEGPMDLLLYLVRKEEVDIYDIPIARITEQYCAYIEMLKDLDIDIAGDFLVMAATLMEIKSAMLLPHLKITELLMEVDEWTGFTRHFTHLKTGDIAKDIATNDDPG